MPHHEPSPPPESSVAPVPLTPELCLSLARAIEGMLIRLRAAEEARKIITTPTNRRTKKKTLNV